MLVEILGMKGSKGTMDNGSAFDSTKVYVKTRMDESKGNQKGFAGGEYAFGKAEQYDKYKHLPFPFMAEVEFEQVTNGSTVKTIITSIQPKQPAKAA